MEKWRERQKLTGLTFQSKHQVSERHLVGIFSVLTLQSKGTFSLQFCFSKSLSLLSNCFWSVLWKVAKNRWTVKKNPS